MANYDLDYEGSVVQDILDTGKALEDAGYIFRGEATPSTVPGTPTERMAYIGGPGTYNNFGTTVVVPSGSIVVITYSSGAWSKTVINASLPVSTTLENNDTTIPTGKAVKTVTDAIQANVGNGYVYAGIATPTTTPVSGKVFYIAIVAGTYTNFGGLVLTQGINILKYNGSVWSQEQVIAIDSVSSFRGKNLTESGAVYEIKSNIDEHLKGTQNIFKGYDWEQGIINGSGIVVVIDGCYVSDFLPVEANTQYFISYRNGIPLDVNVVGFYNNGEFISRVLSVRNFTTPATCTHIRIAKTNNEQGFEPTFMVSKNGILPFVPYKRLENTELEISKSFELIEMIEYGLVGCIDKYTFKNFLINSNNMWAYLEKSSFFLIPVQQYMVFEIENRNTYNCVFAFLKDDVLTLTTAPNFVYKYSQGQDPVTGKETWDVVTDGSGNPVKDTRQILKSRSSISGKVPPGTKFIYISATSINDENQKFVNLPTFVKIGGIIYNNTVEEENEVNKEYMTIFFDDFKELNRDVWKFHSQQKPISGGGLNSRFETNDNNVFVEDSCLVLDCAKTADSSDGTYIRPSDGEVAQVEYHAPYISSCDFLALSEGRISAKIKISKGITDGTFPLCFWLFGQNNTWAYANEVDIMEVFSFVSTEQRQASDGTIIPAGSHCALLRNAFYYATQQEQSKELANFSDVTWALYNAGVYDRTIDFLKDVDPSEWHVYTVEFNKDNYTVFIDDVPVGTYSSSRLGAIDAQGNTGFLYPEDIRFNIKASEISQGEHAYMYIDWVRAEVLNYTPCLSISHDDVSLSVGGSKYINPTFNVGCSNKAFSISIQDDGIIRYEKYLNNSSQMVAHRIVAVLAGDTVVTLHSANGRTIGTFNVHVS